MVKNGNPKFGKVNHLDIVRTSYIQDISSIIPYDDIEAFDIKESITWLNSSGPIHKPQNMEIHIGVLGLLLTTDMSSVFLINHKKAQMWIPPGGHVDNGLSFRDALRAEMNEELQIDPEYIDENPFFFSRTLTSGSNAGHIDATAWYRLRGDPSEIVTIQEKEASEGKWFSMDDLKRMPHTGHLPRVAAKLEKSKL